MTLYCQSCGMPMEDEKLYGTTSQREPDPQYCHYCYQDGAFTQPDFKIADMINFCLPILVGEGMPEQEAKKLLEHSLPSLKRWQAQEGGRPIPELTPDRFETLDRFFISGTSARTTNLKEMSGTGVIAGLWSDFWAQQQSPPTQPIYSLYTHYESDASGEYDYVLGMECVDEEKQTNSAMAEADQANVFEVPAARYAVFVTRTGPLVEVVVEAWQAIWNWSQQPGNVRTYTGDFELYNERSMNPEAAQVEIFIAVK
ncbi:zinc ribbon domain-containing protein [Paenibacillus sp. UMB4589-SE434]|uniref:zinc ribbon domain-containing protein n=1 Tax=Paenibacillus sp. UMB4589-SE434 TaxID=3046314 RepID=UPI0025505389|nr:zinc ribbon domain-containing protein [Paenibacillus sp. UMB4589-SE434]MDK8182193.1 zinc ribbon domain-containing protein [Paenibacillus sp. UMB4589-SE434]